MRLLDLKLKMSWINREELVILVAELILNPDSVDLELEHLTSVLIALNTLVIIFI